MTIDNKVLAYWQHCAKLYSLANSNVQDIRELCHAISRQEIETGKIATSATIKTLLQFGNTIVIAPIVANNNDQYFIPYYLLAEINSAGEITAKEMLALPVFPKTVVESAELRPIVLEEDQQFENYMVINPPAWQDDPAQLSWQNQLEYAEQLLSMVTNDAWQGQLKDLSYVLQTDAFVFSLSALSADLKFDVDIIDDPDKVELVHSDQHTDTYGVNLIEDAWVEAAVKQASPPRCVWMQYDSRPAYAHFFAEEALTTEPIEVVHQQLKAKFEEYCKGKQLLEQWQNISNALQVKYLEQGNVNKHHQALAASLHNEKLQYRSIQAVYDVWLRQVDLIPKWTALFDVVPTMQRRRLERLYKFFADNLPQENVTNFSQAQMEAILQEKLRTAKQNLYIATDAMQEVEADLLEVNTVRNKLSDWQQQNNCDIASNQLWHAIVELAKQYWQLQFNNDPKLADFRIKTPDRITTLIIDHAQYIPPMLAAALLAKSEKAVIIGNDDALINPYFSPQIDYQVAKAYGLVSCDSDFEDLQYDGILASGSSIWNLAITRRELEREFAEPRTYQLEYSVVDTVGTSQAYRGSRVNFAEIDAIIAYLRKNYNDHTSFAVYTGFSAQRQCLQDILSEKGFDVPVQLLQKPCFEFADCVLFSPVYTIDDQGPYCFDRGASMLDQMLAHTRRSVVLIGDSRIFKPQLHSASGKFAKLFINNNVKEEVPSV